MALYFVSDEFSQIYLPPLKIGRLILSVWAKIPRSNSRMHLGNIVNSISLLRLNWTADYVVYVRYWKRMRNKWSSYPHAHSNLSFILVLLLLLVTWSCQDYTVAGLRILRGDSHWMDCKVCQAVLNIEKDRMNLFVWVFFEEKKKVERRSPFLSSLMTI